MNLFKREYNYSDIYLVPQKTIVNSRKECCTKVEFGKFRFDVPIYPANMKSVVDENTCEYFAKAGWFYTMHRFEIDPLDFTIKMKEKGLISSISMGVNEESYEQIRKFKSENITPDYITVDIANCWCTKGERMIKYIKDTLPDTFLIGGNVATPEAVEELEEWGVDSTKTGVAGGKVCLTKNKTGFHRPMVSTVYDCCEVAKKPIIADGGITEHGDIAKAIALGATMVMAGSLFAGYDESAGNVVEINGRMYKEYFGSASEHNKGEYKNVEGKKILVDYKGDIKRLLVELKEDLQSSISYAGGKTLGSLKYTKIIAIN